MRYPPLFPHLANGSTVFSAPQRRRIIDIHGNEVTWTQVDVGIRYHSCGDLVLPTGRIVASDPEMIQDFLPFKQQVKPDRYPLELVMATFTDAARGERVALALIRFTRDAPVIWESAAREDEDPRSLGRGEAFAYGVDTGAGCFADASALEATSTEPRAHQYGEWLSGDPTAESCSGVFVADESSGANIVVFRSGMGDGQYSSYFGYNSADQPCCLVTDFDVVELQFPIRRPARKWWKFW